VKNDAPPETITDHQALFFPGFAGKSVLCRAHIFDDMGDDDIGYWNGGA